MIYLLCGALIGVVMGLTGAGGALVAIPLFMQFLGMSLKDASVYSLIAVVLASLINFFSQRKETQYPSALLIITASAVGSLITAPYKEILPSIYVAFILACVSLYALYSVWIPVKVRPKIEGAPRSKVLLSINVGLILGALTTFTGLGGGVLMLPVFLAFFQFSHSQAVGTSLLAVGLSSLASLVVQISRGDKFEGDMGLVFLMIGILSSVFILKKMTKLLSNNALTLARQIVFTIVVVLALAKIF